MESVRVLRLATAKGVRVFLSDGRLMATPSRLIDAELRSELHLHKAELVDFLTASEATRREVLALARVASEHFRDGPEARLSMKEACLNTPPEMLDDLLVHFRGEYAELARALRAAKDR